MKIEESIPELREKCQSVKKKDSRLVQTGYLIHRTLSIYITRALLPYGWITPNIITISMFFVVALGVFSIVYGQHHDSYWVIVGLFLFYFSFLLDKVDGEIARYREIYSVRGVYLDDYYHFLTSATLIFSFFILFLFNGGFDALWVVVSVLLIAGNYVTLAMFPMSVFFKIGDKLGNALKVTEKKDSLTRRFLNMWLWKPFSFVTRFDILVLYLFAVWLGQMYMINLSQYALWFLCLSISIVFVRSAIDGVLGRVDEKVTYLSEEVVRIGQSSQESR